MTRDIALMFYDHGGYESNSTYSEQDNYISYDDLTSTYIPQALMRMNSLCSTSVTVSYSAGTVSSGGVMDDVILAELALSIADSEYDKLHIDPESYQIENKHWMTAHKYMLDMYGISMKGELLLPKEAILGEAYTPYGPLDVATMSD